MQENMIKLIAIDLDGTLLNRKGQIDEPTAKAVRRAAKQGTIIVISTGRPIEEVPEEQLNGIGVRYVVALNGAAIYKMPEGKCIAQRTMPAEQAASLIEELSRLEVYPDVFAGQMEYGLGDREEMLDRLPLPSDIRNYIRTHSFFIPDLPGFIRRRNMDILKISVSFLRTRDGSVLDFEEAEEILKNYEDLSVTSGGEHNHEITGSDVTKGSSMELLLKEESVTWDEVMAIGDSKNDLDMITRSGLGIAMSNGSEVLKHHADYVVASNADNGVGEAITLFALRSEKKTKEEDDMSFLELAKERYSCRKFSNRLVEPEKLEQILQAGMAAPTAKNFQPVHLWVLSSKESIEKVNQVTRCIYGATTVIAVGCREEDAYVRDDGKNYADVDASIVATHIMMEAQDLGLNTTWVGWFDAPKLHELFPEMDGYDVVALFPVGYASDDTAGQPSPRHTERKTREELVTDL